MLESNYSFNKLPKKIQEASLTESGELNINLDNLMKLKEEGELMGAGGSRFVIPDPTNPSERVLAVNQNLNLTPKQGKQIYYGQKILSTLFPHNFPKIYVVNTGKLDDKDHLPVEIRQRIFGKKIDTVSDTYSRGGIISLFESARNFLKGKNNPKYPYSKVRASFDKLGLKDYIGDNEYNFMNGDDGGQYFVDVPFEYEKDLFSLLSLDSDKLKSFMIKNKYSESDQRIVLSALNRLHEISLKEDDSISEKV